jgi:hypothetical protein
VIPLPLAVLLQLKDISTDNPLLQYGLAGIVILLLASYIYTKDKSHKEERAEWRKDTAALVERHEIAVKNLVDKFDHTLNDLSKLMVRVETKLDDSKGRL